MPTLVEEIERLRYVASYKKFPEWLVATAKPKLPEGYRWGQHLYNSAPAHICNAVNGHPHLDPFHVRSSERLYVINNFLTLCELIWEVTDKDQIKLAIEMVLSEPNAVR